MRRGEVWWARLPSHNKSRPVLLVMRDSAYAVRSQATIAPITRTIRQIPSHVQVTPEDGVPSRSVIRLDHIQTIAIADLERRITSLSADKMAEVDRAIKFALALR